VSEVRIKAEPRTEFGKGAARRVRREHRVPAVLYGHGTPPRHVSLPGHELMLALKTPNVLLRLEGLGNGDKAAAGELALPKSIQRDVVTGLLEHVDLLLVRSGEKVTVEVPVRITGTPEPGGILDQQLVTIALQAEATHIPGQVEVSVDGLDVGSPIHAGDLSLPTGSTLHTDPAAVVVQLLPAPTAAQMEAEITGAVAEVEEPLAGIGQAPEPPAGEGASTADAGSGQS
jgi:large subunit ribosomal protein L25